jgi:hypothetical protein
MKKFLTCLMIFYGIHSGVISQNLLTMERDTVYYGEYIGVEKFGYYNTDTSFIKHGKYTFDSRLFNVPISNKLQQLKISGNYKDEKFDGFWEYKLSEYDLDIFDLNDGRVLELDYQLNGIERNARFSYQLGIPQGVWRIDNVIVENKRKLPESSGAIFRFRDGVAVGDFSFEGVVSKSALTGNLNNDGFLNGEVTIQYLIEGNPKLEKRNYENGFLTKIEVFSGGQLEQSLIFEDVIQQLDDSNGKLDKINFTISEEGFGSVFQNGYNEEDSKLLMQKAGNEVFERVIERYNRFSGNSEKERTKPQFKLTRRFKFIYPDEEDSLVRFLEPKLKIMLSEYNDFLSNPKFILNKSRIDSLPYIFGFIDHARKKSQEMLDVVELIRNGYFDFLYRPNYYPNGLTGLNRPDIFLFEENQIQKEASFDLGVYVDSPIDMVNQMNQASEILSKKADKFLEYSFLETKIFDEQASIDSLDNLIVQLRTKTDALYSFFQIIPVGKSFEEMPLDYRVYRVLHNNLIQKLQEDYLDAEEFENKILIGKELTCILNFLSDEFKKINEIEQMPERLEADFTRFSPNPFFERDIETKILQGIYNKGTGPLFNEYINDLFSSRNCKELKDHIGKFDKLEKRLKELARDSDDLEVGRLDRALRRENIPSRIERLLNL